MFQISSMLFNPFKNLHFLANFLYFQVNPKTLYSVYLRTIFLEINLNLILNKPSLKFKFNKPSLSLVRFSTACLKRSSSTSLWKSVALLSWSSHSCSRVWAGTPLPSSRIISETSGGKNKSSLINNSPCKLIPSQQNV